MMPWVAGLMIGLAVYNLMGGTWTLRALSWVSVGLWPGWFVRPTLSSAVMIAALNAAFLLTYAGTDNSRQRIRQKRWRLVRFWRTLSFFLTAGMTFWQAMDQAIAAVPEVSGSMRAMASALARSRTEQTAMLARFRDQYPGPEGELISTMVVHGYRHGIRPEDAMKQAWDMEEQLSLEEALRRQSNPILLTVLPAVLLLNVLLVFVAPMGLLALKSWTGIGS